MTTGNETDPRDDALARAWRAQSQEMPPPALDAAILAAAHRAVGSGPRDAGQQAAEATRPQRWWMPLAAAATIGVVAIGILQIAPQAPVDIVVGERAEVAGRVAPVVPAAPAQDAAPGNVISRTQEAAPAKDAASGNVVVASEEAAPAKNVAPGTAVTPPITAPSTAAPAAVAREKKVAPDVAPAPAPPAAAPAVTDARKQVAVAPSPPTPEPFPADKLSSKADAQSPMRQNERKDAVVEQGAAAAFGEAAKRSAARSPSAPGAAPSSTAAAPPLPAAAPPPMAAPAPMPAPAPAPMMAQAPAPPAARAPAPSMLAPAPMKKESMAGAAGSLADADSAAKPAAAVRERDTSRDDASARNAPAAASPELARSTASPAELQIRARDPDAWIARIRKLRADGRVAEAVAEVREFRRYVPDAETRLPTDLRQLVPIP